MGKYEISARINGSRHSEVVEAKDKNEALDIAWSKWDVDDVYVSKVPNSLDERLGNAMKKSEETSKAGLKRDFDLGKD